MEILFIVISIAFISIIIFKWLKQRDEEQNIQPNPYTTNSNSRPIQPKIKPIQPKIKPIQPDINPIQLDNKAENTYMPYRKKKLLTYTEYQFYKIMKQACDEKNLLICPKVRLEDFIDVTDRRNRMKYRGYIKSRHIDFIVTDNQLNLLCGIELDDPSHQKPEAAKTDNFKNNLFKTINIPLFRIDTSTKYEIRMNYIFRQLGLIPPTQTYQVEQEAKKNKP